MRFVQQRSTTPAFVDEDALRVSLQEYPLSMAVLFGSHVDGTAHRLSDLDVAVRFEDTDREIRDIRLLDEITTALTRTSGFESIDVVNLDDVPPKLGYEILSQGTVLIGEESEVTELESQFLLRTLDFEPVTDEWHAALDERIAEGTYGRPQ